MERIFTFEAPGALPDSVEVVAFHGSEAVSALDRHEVYVHLPLADARGLDLDGALLRRAVLRAHRDDGSVRAQVHGILAAVEFMHALQDTALLRVELVPSLWKLTLHEHCRVWVRRTPREFLDATLRAGGLGDGDFELRLDGRYRPIEHVCQYRESDFDFVSRWCERLGIHWYFDHRGDRELLVLTDGRRAPESLGALRYFPVAADDAAAGETVDQFSARRTVQSERASASDHDPLAPDTDLNVEHTVRGGHHGDVRRWNDHYATVSDGRALTTLRADALADAHTRFFGAGRVFEARAGFAFTLEDHPHDALNASYLTLSVELHGNQVSSAPEVRALLGLGAHRTWGVRFTAARADVPHRPLRRTPWPRVHGLEPAVIDGPTDGDYAQLDAHGRYLVRLRFDENTHRAGEASTRVRMVQPHAGEPEGMHLPLRAGTEVMVAFLGGDPDRPVIVAASHDAQHPSPVTSANATQNVIHTGANNRIEIDDNADHPYIDLYSPPKHTALHLGEHHPRGYHGGHDHHFVLTTDGNGLVHTGDRLDVTVDGEKHERVALHVDETYHATQTTTVGGDVTETYGENLTVTVAARCTESYRSHTTNVSKRRVEECLRQQTTVRDALVEQHGSQTVTVAGPYLLDAASHALTVSGAAVHTYGLLGIRIGTTGLVHDDTSMTVVGLRFRATGATQIQLQTASNTEVCLFASKKFDSSWLGMSIMKAAANMLSITLAATKFDSTVIAWGTAGLKVDTANVKLKNETIDDKGQAYAFDFEASGMNTALTAVNTKN